MHRCARTLTRRACAPPRTPGRRWTPRRAGAHVLQPLPGGDLLAVEACAVIQDGDEALAVAPADDDLGPRRLRVLAHVRETLLHDAEDLDLLVGGEVHAGVDVELDVERA